MSFPVIIMLLSFFISIPNYFIGPYFSSSFTAWLKFLYAPKRKAKIIAAIENIHHFTSKSYLVLKTARQKYITTSRISRVRNRFLFPLLDISSLIWFCKFSHFNWLTNHCYPRISYKWIFVGEREEKVSEAGAKWRSH